MGQYLKSRFLVATLFLIAGVMALEANQAQATHVGCGDTIFVDTTLDSDLTCSGTALTIGADGITLDLNGHTITGSSTPCAPCPPEDGIAVVGRTGVTVGGGTVTGFVFGVRLVGSDSNVIRGIVVTNNIFNGISLFADSDNNQVKDCALSNNGAFGVIINDRSDNNLVEDCAVTSNSQGVFIGGGGGGAPSFNNTVRDTISNNNFLHGIFILGSDFNVLRDNTTNGNAQNGILLALGADNNMVLDNHIQNNGLRGILVSSAPPQPENNLFADNQVFGHPGIPGQRDIIDATSGTGTAGTRNIYEDNQCATSFPAGLC